MSINELGRNLGKSLLKSGINILSKSIPIKTGKMTSTNARTLIERYFPNSKFVFLDGNYRTISWEDWQKIDVDIYDITKKLWEAEVWDCDDKAYSHKYWTLRIFGIPQFVVHGHTYDKNGKWLNGHFWNAKIADGKLYFYEPGGNKWIKIEKGKKVWIKKKEYRPLTFEF